MIDQRGVMQWLDESRRATSQGGVVDHAAGLSDTCAGDSYVVTASGAAAADRNDVLRLWQSVDGRAVALPTAFTIPGRVTALWSAPGADTATVIVHNILAGRYEASLLALSCTR